MKILPNNCTIRFIDSVEELPVAIEVFGIKKGKEPISVKQNGESLALVRGGVVICRMDAEDSQGDEDFTRISQCISAKQDDAGLIRIECPPKGKSAKEVVPEVGQAVKPEKPVDPSVIPDIIMPEAKDADVIPGVEDK